jgi:hypothetical protein
MNPVGRTKTPTRPGGRGPEGAQWYLLIHQLPPEPLYLRAKIRQRISRVGAVALKNAVYVLPRREECLEDFQWIVEEAVAGGGEAYVCEAQFLEGKTEQALIDQFRAERDADYAALVKEIRDWRREKDGELPQRVARARKLLDEIRKIDFFDAPRRKEAEQQVADLDAASRRTRRRPNPGRSSLVSRVWVTRRSIHIDRIASAWLIRRFVDSRARFRFVDPKEPPRKGEIRFDMVGGDFSHEGDRCTFETLIARTGLTDRALREVGEIVHDIDLKDAKFGRPEAPGIERLITGLALANPEDQARLERGMILFDELYQSFRRKVPLSKQGGA